MKIQVTIPDDIEVELQVFKARNKLITKADAINVILAEKFGLKFYPQELEKN